MKKLVAIFLWTALLNVAAWSQTDKKADNKKPKEESVLVRLSFNLVDEKSQPAPPLGKESFVVYENDIPQQITLFDTQNEAVSYALVMDTSGSMREYLGAIQLFARMMIATLSGQDEMCIVQAKSEPEMEQDLTGKKEDLIKALGGLYASGSTSLLDGVYASSEYLKVKGRNSRRTVIVITDGLETTSAATPAQASFEIGKDDVQVVFVILPNNRFIQQSETPKRDEKKAIKGYATLNGLSSVSGGKIISVYSSGDFDKALREITDLTKAAYRVGYTSGSTEKRGTLRTVRIEARASDGRKFTHNDTYVPVK